MELAQALQILDALADGKDPLTGQPLPEGHLCQQPPVVRALCRAVHELRRQERLDPLRVAPGAGNATNVNAGKPWTEAEEQELARAFEAGATLDHLAVQHGRTRLAIQGRLFRLGRVPAWRPEATPPAQAEAVRIKADAEGIRLEVIPGLPDGFQPKRNS